MNNEIKYCECGCGLSFPKTKTTAGRWKRFIVGHPLNRGPAWNKGKSSWNKGISPSRETRNKLSKSIKGRKIKHTIWNKGLTALTNTSVAAIALKKTGIKASAETKLKLSISHKGLLKGRFVSEETRRKMGIKSTERAKNKEVRARMSAIGKQLWKNPEFVKKVQYSLQLKPNKPETIILNILNSTYPNEWKYTGDFSFMINGKNPDFVNCNGQKKIIELYGDYWHKGDSEQNRIDTFAPFGYQTLIIWEKELKNINKVINKITTFCDGISK